MKDLILVRVKAIDVFTKTTRHGQFHGNPDGSTERTRYPNVPDYVVEELLASHRIEMVDEDEASSLQQLDHDGDGAPGGSKSAQGEDIGALRALYRQVAGKAPFNGWDAAELRRRISLHDGDGAPGEDGPDLGPPAV